MKSYKMVSSNVWVLPLFLFSLTAVAQNGPMNQGGMMGRGAMMGNGPMMGAGMDDGGNATKFEENKKFMLSQMDQRIQALQKAKTCIEGIQFQDANRRENMKKCHQEMQAQQQELRANQLDHKMKQLEQRKAKKAN